MATRIRCTDAGVGDLEMALERFMEGRHSRDLCTVLDLVKDQISWKSAPQAGLVSDAAGSAEKMIKRACVKQTNM